MPVCINCGNRRLFNYDVEAVEVRKCNPESGAYMETVDTFTDDARLYSCYECQSEDVTLDMSKVTDE